MCSGVRALCYSDVDVAGVEIGALRLIAYEDELATMTAQGHVELDCKKSGKIDNINNVLFATVC